MLDSNNKSEKLQDLPEHYKLPKWQDLLAWYDVHARELPWRKSGGSQPDPYAVWLSEIMLQQTTVSAVKPYFKKFLDIWPNVEVLAEARVEDVMEAWAGLGYYSRARNLHLCAQHVVADFGGKFPDNETDLRRLPGIGSYTSAAIASIAFNKRAVVVDGNVERVISRLYAIETPMPKAKTVIKHYADALTPQMRTGEFAQAMMDLGATLCKPRNPLCIICPFSESCMARASNTQELFPVKALRQTRPVRLGAAFVIRRPDGAVLVRRRPPKGLLGGMLELPTTDWSSSLEAEKFSQNETSNIFPFKSEWRSIGKVIHIFTHFSLHLNVYKTSYADNEILPEGTLWLSASDIQKSALPSVFKKALALTLHNP